MNDALFPIGLPEIVAGLMFVALTAYALTGGADFGGGVWDLLASGPRKEAQRTHIATSLAPIWEANHVWLIVVVVILFTGFPGAFAALTTVLHIPLTVMLVGIVLRGSAFVFRSYGARTEVQRHRWGAAFAVSSIVTPIFLGVCVGAIATQAVGEAAWLTRSRTATFGQVFVDPWMDSFPWILGILTLALFAMLAAVYLAYNAPTPELADDFRRRALLTSVVVFAAGAISHATVREIVPSLLFGLAFAAVSFATTLAFFSMVVALWRRRYPLARIAAAATVSGVLWGWAVGQFPFIVPNILTIERAAAPRPTLVLLVTGLAVGAVILIPALRYLYRLFATPAKPI